MKRGIALLLLAALAPACAGEFGSVGRSTRITDGSRVAARTIVPSDDRYRNLVEHLALAEEIYAKQLDNLRDRRASLRSRRRSLQLAAYATFAVTTLVIGASAMSDGGDEMLETDPNNLAGYGALAGLGLGTTLEVMNLMQEDPSNVDAKINHLQASYDNMTDRLRELFEETEGKEVAPNVIEVRAGKIIGEFINEALQINVKG